MSSIGARVREIRLAKGLSQQALAGDGISAGYVSLIESGKRTPSEAATRLLAERLGVPLARLLDEEPGRGAEPACALASRGQLRQARPGQRQPRRGGAMPGCQLDLDELDSQTGCEAALCWPRACSRRVSSMWPSLYWSRSSSRCRNEGVVAGAGRSRRRCCRSCTSSPVTSPGAPTRPRRAKEIEAAGLEGTDEHIRLSSVLVSALMERGDMVFATRHMEQLIDGGRPRRELTCPRVGLLERRCGGAGSRSGPGRGETDRSCRRTAGRAGGEP